MIGIRLFWFGKPRNRSPEDDLVRRYTERLQPWAKFEQIVLKPLNIQSESADKARMLEAQRFLERWDGKDFLVILDERGQQMTSPQMATFFFPFLKSGASLCYASTRSFALFLFTRHSRVPHFRGFCISLHPRTALTSVRSVL